MLDYELTIIANEVLGGISDSLSLEASEQVDYAHPCTFNGEARIIFRAASVQGAAVLHGCLPAHVAYATRDGDVPVSIEIFHSRGMH